MTAIVSGQDRKQIESIFIRDAFDRHSAVSGIHRAGAGCVDVLGDGEPSSVILLEAGLGLDVNLRLKRPQSRRRGECKL